jgi:AraC-like DNA-binding protein
MKNILIFSRNKVLINSVEITLNNIESRVIVMPTFQLITDTIKIHECKLIIIDCDIQFDAVYFKFIKSLQHLNTIPFLLISSINDSRYIENIKYCIPDGYLTNPFNSLDLEICVALIQAKFEKKQEKRFQTQGLENVPYGIKKTLKYIDINIFKKIEIIDLSNLTQWEKNYFIKLFFKYVGNTPYQYILEKKIEIAKSLLIQSDYSINQISFELGFKSYTNFNSAFQKVTFSSPSAFKRVNFRKKEKNIIFIDD